MKKYRVCGTTVVTVYKEVWANDEYDAIYKAEENLTGLTEYCGNFGYDKLVGVEEEGESVAADGYIEWNDVEFLEEDKDYFECPHCNVECEVCESDDGLTYWYCEECDTYYDTDGKEFYPDEDEEEDE